MLALFIYLAGPDRVLTLLSYCDDMLMWRLRGVSGPLYDFVRAAAIALFVVFWVLGVISVQRGLRGISVLLVFSVIFWWLVGGPRHWLFPTPTSDWLSALVVAGAGAALMTGRLARGKR